MPFYENVFIARQDVTAAQVETLAEHFAGIVATQGGEVKKLPEAPAASGEVVDLLAALQKSVAAAKTARGEEVDEPAEEPAEDKKPSKKKTAAKKAPAKKAAAKKTTAKKAAKKAS